MDLGINTAASFKTIDELTMQPIQDNSMASEYILTFASYLHQYSPMTASMSSYDK